MALLYAYGKDANLGFYLDNDSGNDQDERKSTTRYFLYLGYRASRKQIVVSSSTSEVEYATTSTPC